MSFAEFLLRVLTRPRNLVLFLGVLFTTAEVQVAYKPLFDPDIWWVAAAGRRMLATGRVPTENIFSFVEPTHPWIMHEWLLGPAYAWGLDRIGPCVFVAATIALLAIDMALVVAATLGRARHASAGLIMAFAALAGFGSRFLSVRPTHVALVFPIAMTLVAFAPRFGRASIALAVLIEVLWTNVHGSFPLGVALVLLAALDRPDGRRRRIATAGLCAAATCINPYGLALHRFVWNYLRGGDGIYREIHHNIVEFGTVYTAWGRTFGVRDLAAMGVAITLAVLAARWPPYRLRALFCLALLVLAMLQVRHEELAGILTCILLLPYVDECAQSLFWAKPETPGWRRRAAVAALAPACAVAIGLFAVETARRAPDDWIESGPALRRAIDRVPDGANLYAPFHVAGLVIAESYSRGVRVFFDPRNDCYSVSAFRDFNVFDNPDSTSAKIRDRLAVSGTNAVLVDDTPPLASFLDRENGWRMVTRSGKWLVYRREL